MSGKTPKHAGKSLKVAKRDKVKHSVHEARGPKKDGGGGGKGTWGKPGDEFKYNDEAVDPNDPNYDPSDVNSADYELVKVPRKAQEKFRASIEDLNKFKVALKTAIEEYLSADDVAEFLQCTKELNASILHGEIPVVLIKLGLDKTEEERQKLSNILSSLFKESLITDHQMQSGFRKLYNSLDDLILDAPNAKIILKGFVDHAVTNGYLSTKERDSLYSAAEVLTDSKTVQSVKKQVKELVEEYIKNPALDEARTAIKALNPSLHYEVVKQVISYALDLENKDREAASVFLAEFSGAEIRTDQVIKGFTILFQRVEDLVLDVPDVLKLLSSFLGRAVTDEAIPPSLLGRIDLSTHEMGYHVVAAAKNLLEAPKAGLRLSQVWLGEDKTRTNSELSITSQTSRASGDGEDEKENEDSEKSKGESKEKGGKEKKEKTKNDKSKPKGKEAEKSKETKEKDKPKEKDKQKEKETKGDNKEETKNAKQKKKAKKKAAKNKQKAEGDVAAETKEVKADCIFCKIIAGTIPSYKVYETEKALAFLDAFPSAEGHTLVIPKDHYATYDQVPASVGHALHETMNVVSKAVNKLDGVGGFNILQNNGAAAGQVVHHVHFHIIPRRDGDDLFKFPKSGGMIKKQDGDALAAKLISLIKK